MFHSEQDLNYEKTVKLTIVQNLREIKTASQHTYFE